MNNQFAHFIQLGLAIMVMSSSGTLGRYIDIPPPVTIWIRCIIGALALFLVLKIGKVNMNIGWGSQFRIVLASAVLLALHWILYFYALQFSNVAIGMLSLFTYPVITALLEPVILKTQFKYSHLILAVIAFIGVALLIPELDIENNYTLGIMIGVVSALFYSIRNILLKKSIGIHSGITLMFYQLFIVSLILWPVLFIFELDLQASLENHWETLLILGLLTTALGHTLFVASFRHFSISTVSIISALTPLLGTLLGYIFLNEIPAGKTFIGGTLIFITVVIESVLSGKRKR